MSLGWHEPNFAEKKIPEGATVTEELIEYAKNITEATKVLKEDLIKARERISKTDVKVMEHVFPATIGSGIKSSRNKMDKAIKRADQIISYEKWEETKIHNIQWIDGAFFNKDKGIFSPSDVFLNLYKEVSEELNYIPGRAHANDMYHGSDRSYDLGQHLPLFKGNESDLVDEKYNPAGMKSWHHEQIVHRLPPSLSFDSFSYTNDTIFRNVLVDQLVTRGRKEWKENPPVKNVLERISGEYQNPISNPYKEMGEQVFDSFPVEIGRKFCKMDREDKDVRTKIKGNEALSRLERFSISSIKGVQDKRDHLIAMACILDYNHKWFSKGWGGDKRMIESRDEYLDSIPDKKLATILRGMSDHFMSKHSYAYRRGSSYLKIGAANAFLKKLDFE